MRHHQFDLVVQVLGQARVVHAPDLALRRTGSTASAGFMKKNGGSRPVKPISLRMLDVVAADAVDAVHREQRAGRATGNGHSGTGAGGVMT